MKRIVLLDTWTNNANLGNKVIFESVSQIFLDMFPDSFIYQVSALECVRAGKDMLEKADYIFLSGTNQLSSDMERTSEWCADPTEEFWMNKVILLGVGWWQYQAFPPNEYTKKLLANTLNKDLYHSVRDAYTAERLRKMGYRVHNTGCPTLWSLTTEHCQNIRRSKSDTAVLTFTEYNQRPEDDRLLFEIVRKNYSKVFFWPQQYFDYFYAKEICGDEIEILPPNTKAFDNFLETSEVDYIGTRLHAGIKALQKQKRTIIVAIDNRSTEIARDYELPLIQRENLEHDLERLINSSWSTQVNVDTKTEISLWKEQFTQDSSSLESSKRGQSFHVGRWALNYYQSLDVAQDSPESPEEVETLKEVIKQKDTQLRRLETALASTRDAMESLNIRVAELTQRKEALAQKSIRKRDKLKELREKNKSLRQRVKTTDEENEKLTSELARLSLGLKYYLKRILLRYVLPSKEEK